MLTKHWNYNIIEQIFHSYPRYTDRLSDLLFLFLTVNIIRALGETNKDGLIYRKKYVKKFVWGTSIFWLHILLSMPFFVAFFVSLPPSLLTTSSVYGPVQITWQWSSRLFSLHFKFAIVNRICKQEYLNKNWSRFKIWKIKHFLHLTQWHVMVRVRFIN